jgi:AcrR family transcriptional regulator
MNDRSGATRQPGWQRASRAKLPAGLSVDGPRLKILEAALRIFATKGFHGASIRDLAALAELTPSAVYAYFPSKEHVLAELARAGHEAHFHTLQSALLEVGTDPTEQLGALVRANTILHATYPHVAMVVNTEMYALSEELAAPSLALRKQSLLLLLQILDRGARMGAFDFATCEVAASKKKKDATHARDVTAAAIGAMGIRIPYWYSVESDITPKELAEHQVALVMRMVGARAGAGK